MTQGLGAPMAEGSSALAVRYPREQLPLRIAFFPDPDGPATDGRGTEILFGPFRLSLEERRLERDGEIVPLGGRALDILKTLVDRAGQVVSKTDLSGAAWPGRVVEEGSLRFHIVQLRKALGESSQNGKYLTTVAGRGYCFTSHLSLQMGSATGALAKSFEASKLPPPLRHMVGTGHALADVASALAMRRFLTLVGPPGIGKTTLAIQLGHQLADSFADGVAFVDLSSVNGPHLVPNAVAAAVGRLLPPDQIFESLLTVLRGKRMLLIFDGCEHLVDVVADLAEQLFRHLPMLVIIATSRESLRVEGEHVFRLFPLACPPASLGLTAASAMTYPAVELFVDRVQAGQVGYIFSDEDAPIVSEICRKLDGIPLALELAAGRVSSHGIEQIAALLDGRFRLLWQGRRTAPPRHQTLCAALDWSYDLLSLAERVVLRRISVFVGLFSIEAARAVAGADGMPEEGVLEVLADLVAKSLVTLDTGHLGTRYRLLDTTRVYALAKLMSTKEATTIVRKHATYLRDLLSVDRSADAFFAQPVINPYDDQIGNIRTALQWSCSTGEDDELAATLAAVAAPLFLELSLANESLECAEKGLSVLPPKDRGGILEAKLQAAYGLAVLALGGRGKELERAFRRGLEIATERGDPYSVLRFLGGLHAVQLRVGEFTGAMKVAHQARELAKAFDDPSARAMAEAMLTVCHHFAGNHIACRGHAMAAAELPSASACGSNLQFGIDHRSRIKAALARDLWIRGNPLAARQAALDAAEETAKLGNPFAHATSLTFNATVLFWLGDLAAAGDMVRRIVDHAERYLLPVYVAVGFGMKGILELRHGRVEAAGSMIGEALTRLSKLQWVVLTPWLTGALAECEASTKTKTAALERIDAALAMVTRNGDLVNMPDLLRVKGQILTLDPPELDGAAACLEESIAWARMQGASAWELRASVEYARVRGLQGRAAEAEPVLATAIGALDPEHAGEEYRAAIDLLKRMREDGGIFLREVPERRSSSCVNDPDRPPAKALTHDEGERGIGLGVVGQYD